MGAALTAVRARKKEMAGAMSKNEPGWRRRIAALALTVTVALGAAAGTVFAENGQEDAEDMTPHCKASILYEATTGTVLFEKNPDEKLPPASMTKVMTAIVVLEENPDLEGEFTVSEKAVSHYYCSYMDSYHLKAGEVISYEDCMRYLLVLSGNEAATAFAFDMCGDYQEFIDKMNAKAEELGCTNTHFVDCVGLSASDHYTTPRDMARMCEYAMKFDKFRECVSQSGGTLPASNKRDRDFNYDSINYVMFPDDRYESPYARYMTGVKTGFTNAAGWCFSGCMEKDGLVFYSVVMGSELLDYGDGERVIQGDFLDTINLYSLTDGLTADNIAERYPQTGNAPVWMIAAAVAIIVLIALMWFRSVRNVHKTVQKIVKRADEQSGREFGKEPGGEDKR